MAAELGQKTVEFSEVVRRATDDSFLALRELVERSKVAEEQSDSQKKIDLLKYIFKTRQRMLRLHVLAKWCQQVPLVHCCQQLAEILSSHDTCFTQAADSLFFTHEELQQARAPVYDVPSAVEVLLTGSYRRLPKSSAKNLDTLLRSKLLEAKLPKEISEITVSNGTVLLRVDGEFKVLLTLGYRGHLSMWRILHLELLIELRRYALGDELERRMASSEKPFTILYSVLHELCVALVMDTVIKQVHLLRQGRWKDAIRFELISDGGPGQSSTVGQILPTQDGEFDSASQKTPGIKIMYWLDFEKTAAGVDSGLSPFIKIEPGQDLQMRCVHSVFVIDPITDREAEFLLDRSCIDVEGLLQRAIACNKHTRLLEIQRDVMKVAQIFQAEGDVVLKCQEDAILQDANKECWGDEVLCVRAYGSLYITLGINIRSGRFLLQSSKNILADLLWSMTAAEVFISLRSKSILHLFASVGKFLGLKVYERELTTLKIPKSIVNGSDMLLMEFSQCGDDGVLRRDERLRKRSFADMGSLIPSLQEFYATLGLRKRRKIGDSTACHSSASQILSSTLKSRTDVHTYGSILSEANHGLAPHNVYVSALLHVVRHCSLCIKHAQVTSQMDALEIPYVEEVGLHIPSSNLWFRLPFARDDLWDHICLCLGKLGSMTWDVKVNDPYFKELWELQKGSTSTGWGCGVRIANVSDTDSHICFDPEGVVLNYETVEIDSIKKLVSDLQRLSNARLFVRGMRNLLGVRSDDKFEESSDTKVQSSGKGSLEIGDKISEQIKRTFKIEAVGLMSLWFCYGTMPVMAHFVVEWEAGKEGCTMHVSPDQLWPHTKFLEDFINGGEVASFLDCIRLTAGPLLALANAIRPARMPGPVASVPPPILKQNGFGHSQGLLQNTSSAGTNQPASYGPVAGASLAPMANHGLHSTAILSAVPGRGGPGIVPSSLLPFDVSVVLRGPYWIRIIYRKKFAVDMRCFAGDQVWLQPATPPKGGAATGGSLPCPQFRPFIMEHVAQGLNALEPSFPGGAHAGGLMGSNNPNPALGSQPLVSGANRVGITASGGMQRPASMGGAQGTGSLNRVGNNVLPSSALAAVGPGLPFRISPVHLRGELNTAFIGLGDDGGYGGSWVPLAALKKVLRGILKYLGVLWLFAQLPELLKEILGSILKENEGGMLNLDQEQPALRFFVGGYVFSVSVHRVQLLLQIISVKRVHHPQQPQQQAQTSAQEELASSEIIEICDYFSRRVASEPYDTSRVSSFITLLTLPISVLREFLKLIAWEKGLFQSGELCLENHSGSAAEESTKSPASKSDIHHDRAHSSVDFGLTFVLDPALIPHINAAGGAAWLPYCVSVRLRYSFGDSSVISLMGVEGSHGGRACWSRLEDWERCKIRVARAVEFANTNAVVENQGRLRSLQQLRDGTPTSTSVTS
ncbi:unnamed protein product [Spirodela intermedia]|uniref:Mediator of RNA polymerase II transcription subunit 14 n=1 Tax=Spirodela intermedia TaxID=51605 RepID=A0A7I8I9D7_SPIIN|nr:unnamed protein product [Spirodela intermedia]CAA6653682.1 unnamed protein product [Spirodela intermedia]